jgi:hypothetical protein
LRLVADDEPRLLARRSELGYVTHPGRALAGAGEAVDEAYQQLLSDHAELARQQQLRTEWGKCRDRCVSAIAHFEQVIGPEPALRRSLRVAKHGLHVVDKRVGLR